MSVTGKTTKDLPPETPDWLATPIEFEEQRGFVASRRRMRLVLLIVLAALPWAALAPIRELSLAHGQLIPVSQVRPVQHLEGGVVEQILVQEGQLVEQDQPLLRLQTVIADSELAGLKSRAQNLLLQKERVAALLAGRDFNLNGFSDVDARPVGRAPSGLSAALRPSGKRTSIAAGPGIPAQSRNRRAGAGYPGAE